MIQTFFNTKSTPPTVHPARALGADVPAATLPEIEHDNPIHEAARNYLTLKTQLATSDAENAELRHHVAVLSSERDFYKEHYEDTYMELERVNAYATQLETRMNVAAEAMVDGINASKKFAAEKQTRMPTPPAPKINPATADTSDAPLFLQGDNSRQADIEHVQTELERQLGVTPLPDNQMGR